jgi:hypothetical protein
MTALTKGLFGAAWFGWAHAASLARPRADSRQHVALLIAIPGTLSFTAHGTECSSWVRAARLHRCLGAPRSHQSCGGCSRIIAAAIPTWR